MVFSVRFIYLFPSISLPAGLPACPPDPLPCDSSQPPPTFPLVQLLPFAVLMSGATYTAPHRSAEGAGKGDVHYKNSNNVEISTVTRKTNRGERIDFFGEFDSKREDFSYLSEYGKEIVLLLTVPR